MNMDELATAWARLVACNQHNSVYGSHVAEAIKSYSLRIAAYED